MSVPKIAFFGTPGIAAQCLETLIGLPVEVVLVVTQPDKQKDRKNNVIFSATKQLALAHKLKILQPERIKDITAELASLKLDLIITCAYGQIVNEEILKLPTYGCVNIHASLLPQLRGGAPIHRAIINQLPTTGISFIYMAKQMDAGDILFQSPIEIANDDTYQSLLIKLTQLAQSMLNQHFKQLLSNDLKTIAQDETQVTFGYNIKKHEEVLNFHQTAQQVAAWIRGLYNKPLAKINYQGLTYKVHHAYVSNIKSTTPPGTINTIDAKGIAISTTDYDLVIDVLQAPNKNPLAVKAMLNGNFSFKINTSLDGNK